MQKLPKIIAVVGPTGTGKTALAEALALSVGGELVSCDAKQVYCGMDIGTNKEKHLNVPQHLLDIKEPGERVTVAEYQVLAYRVIDELLAQGKVPVLVGGSMLYAEAVMNGYVFSESGKSTAQLPRYTVLALAPQVDRAELKQRLAVRTQAWIKAGLLAEIRGLLAAGVPAEWLKKCGLEYRYVTEYIEGDLTEAEAIRLTNISLNQYVKRQYTWWRRRADLHWVSSPAEAKSLGKEFLET